MIIDFHTHIYPPKIAEKGTRFVHDFYVFPYTRDASEGFGTLAHLDRSCAEAGVDYKVVLAVAVKPDNVRHINDWLSGCLNGHTIGFGTLHADFDDPVSELERFSSLGFKGLKFHPDMQQFNIDDDKMMPVYEWAEAHDMPINFHTGDPRYDFSSPIRLSRVLDRFPKLRVIASHLGGYGVWETQAPILYGRPNVYFDTSSSLLFLKPGVPERIIERHGTDKILFGTDYPIATQAEELARFDKLELDAQTKKAILFDNGARLLSIGPR